MRYVRSATIAGLVLLMLGPIGLLATNHVAVRISADDAIEPISIWSALLPSWGYRVHLSAMGVGLATLLTWHGSFAMFQGYVWSRYRNIWITALVHIVTNLIYVDWLIDRLL